MKSADKFPAHKEFQLIMHNDKNKIRLQNLLREEISQFANDYNDIRFIYSVQNKCWNVSHGKNDRLIDFECNQIEADTIMFFIYSRIRARGCMDTVVIHVEDTDVLTLASYVSNKEIGNLIIKRKGDFFDAKQIFRDGQFMPQFHVFSGCDTVSGFFGQTKKLFSIAPRKVILLTNYADLETLWKLVTICVRKWKSSLYHAYGDNSSTTMAIGCSQKWKKMKKMYAKVTPRQ